LKIWNKIRKLKKEIQRFAWEKWLNYILSQDIIAWWCIFSCLLMHVKMLWCSCCLISFVTCWKWYV
jgi:hypothetical protein